MDRLLARLGLVRAVLGVVGGLGLRLVSFAVGVGSLFVLVFRPLVLLGLAVVVRARLVVLLGAELIAEVEWLVGLGNRYVYGDDIDDVAVYVPGEGNWLVLESSTGALRAEKKAPRITMPSAPSVDARSGVTESSRGAGGS